MHRISFYRLQVEVQLKIVISGYKLTPGSKDIELVKSINRTVVVRCCTENLARRGRFGVGWGKFCDRRGRTSLFQPCLKVSDAGGPAVRIKVLGAVRLNYADSGGHSRGVLWKITGKREHCQAGGT